MLFAAGAVLWEEWTNPGFPLRAFRYVLPGFALAGGIISLPLALPVLPPERIPSYMQALGIRMSRTESDMSSELPQHFADQFGWEEMVSAVARVYNSLPSDQRAKTAILGGNYGEAGAIDFFGPHYALPKSISAHQNYYYWGPRQYTGESIILLQWRLESAQKM